MQHFNIERLRLPLLIFFFQIIISCQAHDIMFVLSSKLKFLFLKTNFKKFSIHDLITTVQSISLKIQIETSLIQTSIKKYLSTILYS